MINLYCKYYSNFLSVDTKELVAAEVCYGQCQSGCVCAASLWYNV